MGINIESDITRFRASESRRGQWRRRTGQEWGGLRRFGVNMKCYENKWIYNKL